MVQIIDNILVCPVSKSKFIHKDDSFWIADDGIKYPVVDGIPILVKDYDAHLDRIKKFQQSHKEEWYTDDQVESYDEGPYRHHLKRRSQIVKSWIQDYFSKSIRLQNMPNIVDLGCGDGGSSRWLVSSAPKNSNFILLDYNYDRLIKARYHLSADNIYHFLSDITNPPILDETIDLVFSNHVIEHVPNDIDVFKSAYNMLKPGGVFILGCPNEGVFWWMLAYALSPKSIRHTDHIHFYDADVLVEMATSVGLIHSKTERIGYGIPHWVVDYFIRRYKIVDDVFHFIGKILFPGQASSLYLAFTKPNDI